MRRQADLQDVGAAQLRGFFAGWPDPPAPETLLRLLASSHRVALAVNDASREVVGFAQAISDGVRTAFIPLLEVRTDFQGQGVGTALAGHLLAQLEHLYAVDLWCDEEPTSFYGRLGFRPGRAMVLRRYGRQNGKG